MVAPDTDDELDPIRSMIRADYDAAAEAAHVPSSGEVWKRAVIRAQVDAQRTAARPITMLHAAASACAAGLTCGALTWVAPAVSWTTLWHALPAQADAVIAGAALARTVALVVALTASLLFAPIAIYLLLTDD